jgi:RHS repeat-associated protein
MPVTNYYTVNGAIIGESTAGVRTDYMVDALGSVTGTVNQSGQVMNTYRYKPYGALLAKTGTGTDPKMQWVGSLGYRETGRRQSDVYVRARHYGSAAGRWTTPDRLWPTRPAYGYGRQSPAVATDPTGTDIFAGKSNCGGAMFGSTGKTVSGCYKKVSDAFNKVLMTQAQRDAVAACARKYPGAPQNLSDLYEKAVNSSAKADTICTFCEGPGHNYGLPDACSWMVDDCNTLDNPEGYSVEYGEACPPVADPLHPNGDEKRRKCKEALEAMGCGCGIIVCAPGVGGGYSGNSMGCCNYLPFHEVAHCITGKAHEKKRPDWIDSVSRCVCEVFNGKGNCDC